MCSLKREARGNRGGTEVQLDGSRSLAVMLYTGMFLSKGIGPEARSWMGRRTAEGI